jgi:hypothetical protein
MYVNVQIATNQSIELVGNFVSGTIEGPKHSKCSRFETESYSEKGTLQGMHRTTVFNDDGSKDVLEGEMRDNKQWNGISHSLRPSGICKRYQYKDGKKSGIQKCILPGDFLSYEVQVMQLYSPYLGLHGVRTCVKMV